MWWPYHKYMAVKRGLALEAERRERIMERLRNGDDDDTIEWGAESFSERD